MKLNFFKAYAAYCSYCRQAAVKPEIVSVFAEMWHENKTMNHENCNYNYLEDII